MAVVVEVAVVRLALLERVVAVREVLVVEAMAQGRLAAIRSNISS